MRELLIADGVLNPEDTDHTGYPLIYVTLDTTFREAIHANPDHLTMFPLVFFDFLQVRD